MLYPLFFMVMLTFVIMLFTLRIRLASVRRGEVSLSYFSISQGKEIPDLVIKTCRDVANFFEVPVLLYAAGVLYVVQEMSQSIPVTLAWLFVFGIGNLSFLGMWMSIVASANAA